MLQLRLPHHANSTVYVSSNNDVVQVVKLLLERGALDDYHTETKGGARVQFQADDADSDASASEALPVNSPLNWAAFKVCCEPTPGVVMLLFLNCSTASRYSSNKVHTHAHIHTFVLLLHSFTLNHLWLQQYTTPTVYVSSKLPSPQCPALHKSRTLCRPSLLLVFRMAFVDVLRSSLGYSFTLLHRIRGLQIALPSHITHSVHAVALHFF